MLPGYPRQQERLGEATPLHRFGRWANGVLWEPKILFSYKASGTLFPQMPDSPVGVVSLLSTSIGHIQNLGREPMTAKFDESQKTVIFSDPNFNLLPNRHGKIPDQWLILQRCNPLFNNDKTLAWVEMVFVAQNVVIGALNEDDTYTGPGDLPQKWSDLQYYNRPSSVPANVLDDPSIFFFTDSSQGSDTGYILATSFRFRQGFVCAFEISRTGLGSRYQPKTSLVYPSVGFDGPLSNFDAEYIRDDLFSSKYKVKTKLMIDGTKFISGLKLGSIAPQYGPNNEANDFFGSIDFSINWSERGLRPL